MISSLASTLRWTLSLGSKFARVVPFSTLIIIALTLVSQITMLVASLLPLKVVVLLGSETIPSYFPTFMLVFGSNVLIFLLGFITIAFFMFHLLAEQLIIWRIKKATRRLLQMSQKMSLFEQQEQIAQDAYLRFSRALASTIFVLISFIGLAFFYQRMVVAQLGYLFLAVVILWLLHRVNKDFRESLENKPGPILNLVAVIGFFISFIFLILDFVLTNSSKPLIAIVSLLLTRQVMSRIAGIVIDFFLLQRDRIKLDALFFHGKVFMPKHMSDGGIWTLLRADLRSQWVARALSKLELNYDNKELLYRWQGVGVPDIAAFEIELTSSNVYLFKIYETNRSALAQHEFSLLSENIASIPALKFIGNTEVDTHMCLVYQLTEGNKPDLSNHRSAQWAFRSELIATPVPTPFVNHYRRSKPMLWQRILSLPLERLQIFAEGENEKKLSKELLESLHDISSLLSALPISILNPNISMDDLWMQIDQRCVGLQWGQWSLEPIGAGWPERDVDFVFLKEAWPKVLKKRHDLANVPMAQIELAALVFALERDFNRQRFRQAIALLPRIFVRLELLEKEAKSEK